MRRFFFSLFFLLPCARIFGFGSDDPLVISQFAIRGPESRRDQFIELYNRTSSTMPIGGWSVQYKTARSKDSESSWGSLGREVTLSSPTDLAPYGYFLIVPDSAEFTAGEGVSVADLAAGWDSFMSKDGHLRILSGDGVTVLDQVGWGGNANSPETSPAPAQDSDMDAGSVERKNGSPSGNSVDTGDNSKDFQIRSVRKPRSSMSGPEPPSVPPPVSTFPPQKKSDDPPRSQDRPPPANPAAGGRIRGLITEVAPSLLTAQGGPFIKIQLQDRSDLSGVELREGSSLLKFFPPMTVEGGQDIIILVNDRNGENTDESGVHPGGPIHLFAQKSGLHKNAGNLSLWNPDGTCSDFMSYAKADSSYGKSLQRGYDSAAEAGRWNPKCDSGNEECYAANSVLWSGSKINTLSRRLNPDRSYSNTESASDWIESVFIPGDGGGDSKKQKETDRLDIFQSPFSPYGDGKYREAIISYTASAGSSVRVQIFDLNGSMIRTLTEISLISSRETRNLAWDGKNLNFETVPVGIYLVRLEVRGPDKSLKSDLKTVIVGRKL